MRRAFAIWGGALGGLTYYDVVCGRRDDNSTLSSCIRWLVEHLPFGRLLFRLALWGGAWWFDRHILRPLVRAALAKETRP